MGSGGSKGSCRGGGGASSSSGGRKAKSTGINRVFQSSCLGAPSGSADSQFDSQVVVVDHHNKDYGSYLTNRNMREPESEPNQMKGECSRKVKGDAAPDYEMPLPCMSSGGSSSNRATAAVHHSSSRCLSGFSFLPGNVSFRLSRANSLGSSRALELSKSDDNSETLEHVQNASTIPVILNDVDRERDRRVGVGIREPVERNARFSRTLSVGRLRDRVLQRASLSDFTLYPVQQNCQLENQTQAFGGDANTRQSATSPSTSTSTSISGSAHATPILSHNPVFNIQEHEVET